MAKSAILKVDIISDYNAKGTRDATKSFDDLNRAASVASAAIVGGLAVATGKAVQDASALAESVNAVDVTFGNAAGTIADYGKVAAESAGLSQREFNEMSTKTGALLQNFGMTSQEAADSTVALTERAADMASVMNTDVGTALDAINAGLRGENEQLLQYGVNLDDATLKAKAMEMGLYSGTGALDDNARAAAAQAVIMEQTDKMSGDFAATSDSLANRQRILKAEMENTSAQLGESLTPLMETAVGVFQTAVTWIQENEEAFKRLIVVIGGLAAGYLAVNAAVKVWTTLTTIANAIAKVYSVTMKLLSVSFWKQVAATIASTAANVAYNAIMMAARIAVAAYTVVQWLLNVAMAANPIMLVVLAVMALVAIFVVAYQKIEPFREIVDKLWQLLKNSVVGAFDAVSAAISTVVGWLKDAWEWVKKLVDKFTSFKLPSWVPGVGAASMTVTGVPTVAGRAAGGGSFVNVTVNTGIGDPHAIAKAIRRTLAADNVRMGRA